MPVPESVCVHNPESLTDGDKRGIEVGHIFQLGRKYSQAMESRFTNESGRDRTLLDGLLRHRNLAIWRKRPWNRTTMTAGICWPPAIAPVSKPSWWWPTSRTRSRCPSRGGALYNTLLEAGIDVLIWTTARRGAGVKFKDVDLIGIPWRIVIGRDASRRNGGAGAAAANREMQKLPHPEAVDQPARGFAPLKSNAN